MKTIGEFLAHVRSLKINLWAEGDTLGYSAPEGVVTQELLAEIGQRKPEILAFINEAVATSRPDAHRIRPVARDRRLPLSFAQERLWFLNQLEPDNPFYNIPCVLYLRGVLNSNALEQSLNEMVRRHESLRTNFRAMDGQPVQIIAPELKISLSLIDLRDLSEIAQSSEVQRLTEEESRRPFNLANEPLVRATLLLRRGAGSDDAAGDYVLLLTMHHIVSDGWSMGILVHELPILYNAYSTQIPARLPKLSIQYADFAVWQRQRFRGQRLKDDLNYWKRQLAGIQPTLELPTARSRPPVQSFRGGSERFKIDKNLTEAIRLLTQEAEATLFMTLLSALAVLLARYSGQQDLIIGSPIANRNHREIEPLIGFFVNTLALRMDLSGNPTFRELLNRVRQTALEVYAHQDLPFEKLVDELQPERDLSRNPLFQVMFALQNAPQEQLQLSDLEVTIPERERTSALFDLCLDMWQTEQGLIGVLEYSRDLFDAATIQRMIEHFRNLLAEIAANPKRPVSELPFLTAGEKHQLLKEWKGISAAYPLDKPLHELFEAQVEADPHRVAACHGDRQITYHTLNEKTNRIAHFLRRIGVQPNEFVGILDARGIDFLAAILGILKAGGAYLPIDPDYPEDRIRYMMANSRIRTLITRASLLKKFFSDATDGELRHILCPARLHPQTQTRDSESRLRIYGGTDLLKEDPGNPACVNSSDDLAYMLYTSGSTGLPKGAMIRHNGAVNHIYGQFDALKFHSDTVFLQSAPASSDISVWQFLAPLLIGGKVVIIDRDTLCNPMALFNVIRSLRITLIELVPAVLKEFLEYAGHLSPDARTLPALEWGMVTGEAASIPLVNQWLNTFPGIPLVNAYGPTEAADDVCQMVLKKPLPRKRRNVPIGSPLANLALYVLDGNRQLLPIGVPGEICVAGIGVGAGYWQNEEKTRESFVPNPYAADETEKRLYRTGDLGRWLPDGNLEFLGRLDHQVKLRGFRIELGEIEGVLGRYSEIREAVVIDREDAVGDKRLAAYIVPNYNDKAVKNRVEELQSEQVSLWQELNENTYGEAPPNQDPAFNTVGWDSTYTGKPLSDREMHEYIDHTVGRILSLRPDRALEIGCGTGLLLYRIAPHCSRYVGTDISRVALQRIAASKQTFKGLEHVELLHRKAENFEAIEPESFDTVILSSVVQYFPGIPYLVDVLENAVRAVKPGGAIFLGDIRSLPLLEAYHTSVQLHKAPDGMSTIELKRRIQQQIIREQELIIDPAFFMALRHHLPRIGHVEILPKRGTIHNEMTRFRYDVWLYAGRVNPLQSAPTNSGISNIQDVDASWADWRIQSLNIEKVYDYLSKTNPAVFGLRRVKNARVSKELNAVKWTAEADDAQTVKQLREHLDSCSVEGVEPEDFRNIESKLPYHVDIRCSVDSRDGSYDVVFSRRSQNGVKKNWDFRDRMRTTFDYQLSTNEFRAKPLREYANNPLNEKLSRKLAPRWRDFLKVHLPEHMIPSGFMILDKLPLLPNAKINRDALPVPDSLERASAEGYVPPRTPVEESLAAVWAEVLGLESVGIRHNFFELGGHSLKATQVVSRIHKKLGVEIAVRGIFEFPTIEALAREIGTLQPADPYGEIKKVPDADQYPLSHAQRRLWVLSQMESAARAYNMPDAVILEGDINRFALERAFGMLADRHESLRTTFITVNGNPRQKVHENMNFRITFTDLSEDEAPERRARRMTRREARHIFDLEKGPLIRMSLLKLAENRHVLITNMHHIISDGVSLQVMKSEFMTLYESICNREHVSLARLRIHYRDYADWQNRLLESDAMSHHRAYWHAKLCGDIPVLDLPSDFPRPPVKTFNGRCFSFKLSSEQNAALSAFNRGQNVTLFMTLAALVKTLLYRYTGQKDLVLGFGVAGRDHPDLEDQIGFYVNMLVLRDRIRGDTPFETFLQQVATTAAEAYEHRSYPFDLLVDELKQDRDISRSPLFDVAMVLQNVDRSEFNLEGIRLHPFLEDVDTSQFDLLFGFEEKNERLQIDIRYNTDLFLDSRIRRMGAHLRELVGGILVDGGKQPIGDLPFLPESELHRLLHEFNDTAADYPRNKTIVDLFEIQAAKRADAAAVMSDPTTGEPAYLTYRELNARANRLAHYLREKGVGPDSITAVLEERTPETIVTILGILKAGGAYLPIDPLQPTDRIISVLEDSNAGLLVTRNRVRKEIPFTWFQNLRDVRKKITVSAPRPPIKDISALPFPDRSLVDYGKYDRYIGEGCVKKSISIIATRGCPYHCLYCHNIWPKKHVMRTADNIFREVRTHYERGYRSFTFLDDIFNLDRRNSEGFFELVVKNNLKIRILFPSGLRGDILTPDYIDLMSEAGVMQMALALETASPRLQKLIRKNLDIGKLRENLVYICDKHSHIVIDLFTMFGFPTETEEEALMTLDFIKSIEWLHFPLLHALTIFPNTGMARLAMENGVSRKAIEKSTHTAFHEVSDIMPFSKLFAREYKARYLNEYFLLPKRLAHVIPLQAKVLRREEMIAKYNSYLPGGLENYPEIGKLIENRGYYREEGPDGDGGNFPAPICLPAFSKKEKHPAPLHGKSPLRVLLLDTSIHFSDVADQLANLVEAPLGLMYLLTYLNREFKERVHGKILKSMIDFDSFKELKHLIGDFRPHVIGLRTLSLYKNFFHKTISFIRQWFPGIPIITGGPYATSEYHTLLADGNVDVAVLGEGERTFAELIGKFLDNDKKLPKEDALQQIPGLAFLPRRHAGRVADGVGREVLMLDKISDEIARREAANPKGINRSPDDTAYVIYTSGSTGKPKGCGVTHRNVVRLMINDRFNFDFGPDDTWIGAHSFAFDFSVWEMYGALLYGGKLVIATPDQVRDTQAFRDLLCKHKVTVLNQTPAAFYNLIDVERAQRRPRLDEHLRYVIFGGDRLEPAYLKPWVDIYPLEKIKLVNMYGITETTVHVTYGPLSLKDIISGDGRSPIGVPLPETRVYVCDDRMNPQPIGVRGEIYVGGTGVSRGYLNRPELLAQRFIESPFRKDERLYRSGDLGCRLEDGTLEHLGRNDSQVQIRGFRIELGEIEAVLARHAGVRQCVVISRADESSGSRKPENIRLIAYIVPEEEPVPDIPDLRRLVKEKLPEYMIPSSFVMLDKAPLTANNKIDRRALPDPDSSRPELETAYSAPRTETERNIIGIWKDVLQLEKVGIHDNFFDLGGNSLSIIQVNKKLRELLNRDIAVVDMFKYTTIGTLSRFVNQTRDVARPISPKVRDRVDKQKRARERRRQERERRSPI